MPGCLIYKEAGGYVRQLDGRQYTSKNDGEGLMSAPNEQSWFDIREALFKGL